MYGIYLHLLYHKKNQPFTIKKSTIHVGKYTVRPMERAYGEPNPTTTSVRSIPQA